MTMRPAAVSAVFAAASRRQGDFGREAWGMQIYIGAAVLAGLGFRALRQRAP